MCVDVCVSLHARLIDTALTPPLHPPTRSHHLAQLYVMDAYARKRPAQDVDVCLSWFMFAAGTDHVRAGVARGLVMAPTLPPTAATADDATGLSATGGYIYVYHRTTTLLHYYTTALPYHLTIHTYTSHNT